MDTAVIIVAAGSSSRMGFDKLTAPLAGLPVLQHTLNAFLNQPAVREIVLVTTPERFALLDTAHPRVRITLTHGGSQRQHSVANGLAATSPACSHIAIHDGARPLLHPTDLDRCLAAALTHGAATLARPIVETVKRSDAQGFCAESVPREHLWFMETPQVFATPLLHQALAEVARLRLTVTDEVSAVQTTGHPVRFVESLHPNPKITRPADLALATALLSQPTTPP